MIKTVPVNFTQNNALDGTNIEKSQITLFHHIQKMSGEVDREWPVIDWKLNIDTNFLCITECIYLNAIENIHSTVII